MASSTLAGRPASLDRISEKAAAGERLSFEDGVALYAAPDLHAVAAMANGVRERLNGDRAYYVINRHINYSNLCVDSCLFCSFARKPGQEGGYQFGMEEIRRRGEDLARIGASELHIVGGLHPSLPFSYYEEMLRTIREAHPRVTLKAFTAVEILHFAQQFGMTIEEVLARLKACGLGMLPGGGAEVFSERVRKKLCREKGSADEWFSVHRAAHRLGIPSNCTLLYGHIETIEERVDHMLRIRAQQDETGGFQAFIPLAFHPENNRLGKLPGPTGLDGLRTIAVSRLLLDNVPHIKAYWPMFGIRMAQVALWFGADDMDGTVVEEKIYHMAGAETPQELPEPELRRLIAETRRVPVKRDAFYREAAAA